MRLRVVDITRATVITPDVAMMDTAREPFNVVARNLKGISDCGIWLNPFRGVPQVIGVPALDLVYLDASHRVASLEKNCGQSTAPQSGAHAESALVLPSGSAEASRIAPGDQFRFSDAATGLLWANEMVGSVGGSGRVAEVSSVPEQVSTDIGSQGGREVHQVQRAIEDLKTRGYSPE